MMATSADHQKQKRNLIKPHLLARSIARQFPPLPESPLKRAGLISIGVLTGIGVPTLVFASQQQTAHDKVQTTNTSTVTVQSAASSNNEGAVSSSEPAQDMAQTQSDPQSNATITINGESVPVTDQPISRQIVNSDGSTVDVNITIDNNSSVESSETNNDTHVYINSSSSTTAERDVTRGSPRR